jgi:(p)ppGpp synthase/HD superfamily hydrolase
MELAFRAHKDQMRKNGVPYIIHPLEVIKQLNAWGITLNQHVEVWIAGVLHDVLEDCKDFQFQDLRNAVGLVPAKMVNELTFRDKIAGESIEEYAYAKMEYLRSFEFKSIESLVVKIADRLRNTWDWLETDEGYAVKYFHKADVLFIIMQNRQVEIEKVFSAEVFQNMSRSVENLKAHLDTIRRTV